MSRPPAHLALARPRLLRRLAAAAAFAVSLLAAPPLATSARAADDPLVLRQRITDIVGKLGPIEQGEVGAELKRIEAQDGVRLFVALVDSTGERTADEFAKATAEASSLGGKDALLLIAFEGPSDALWVGPSLTDVTDVEIEQILGEHVERNLASGDAEQAVLDGGYALGAAASGDLGSIGSAASGPGSVPGSEATGTARVLGLPASDVLAALAVLGIVGVAAALFARRQRNSTSAPRSS